ncbi:hypothetical protein CG716_20135 [Mycolicibacterium sphagni]|uniref:Uncharacterized protein n=1 Tax=Mycolicibacterium sphagni TaxID=1786 RepID=A0A255DIS9_9MYCO|nr:hypothetical protein CG716_20135 [Mycolicibacterium sphagni]
MATYRGRWPFVVQAARPRLGLNNVWNALPAHTIAQSVGTSIVVSRADSIGCRNTGLLEQE